MNNFNFAFAFKSRAFDINKYKSAESVFLFFGFLVFFFK